MGCGEPWTSRRWPHDGCGALLKFESLVMATESSTPLIAAIWGQILLRTLAFPRIHCMTHGLVLSAPVSEEQSQLAFGAA